MAWPDDTNKTKIKKTPLTKATVSDDFALRQSGETSQPSKDLATKASSRFDAAQAEADLGKITPGTSVAQKTFTATEDAGRKAAAAKLNAPDNFTDPDLAKRVAGKGESVSRDWPAELAQRRAAKIAPIQVQPSDGTAAEKYLASKAPAAPAAIEEGSSLGSKIGQIASKVRSALPDSISLNPISPLKAAKSALLAQHNSAVAKMADPLASATSKMGKVALAGQLAGKAMLKGAVGGALSGAAIGASAGSEHPVRDAAIGAGLGAGGSALRKIGSRVLAARLAGRAFEAVPVVGEAAAAADTAYSVYQLGKEGLGVYNAAQDRKDLFNKLSERFRSGGYTPAISPSGEPNKKRKPNGIDTSR